MQGADPFILRWDITGDMPDHHLHRGTRKHFRVPGDIHGTQVKLSPCSGRIQWATWTFGEQFEIPDQAVKTLSHRIAPCLPSVAALASVMDYSSASILSSSVKRHGNFSTAERCWASVALAKDDAFRGDINVKPILPAPTQASHSPKLHPTHAATHLPHYARGHHIAHSAAIKHRWQHYACTPRRSCSPTSDVLRLAYTPWDEVFSQKQPQHQAH
jgi:hypothetical protein